MNLDEARHAASAAGLDRLTERDLALLAKSLEANRTLQRAAASGPALERGDRAGLAAAGCRPSW